MPIPRRLQGVGHLGRPTRVRLQQHILHVVHEDRQPVGVLRLPALQIGIVGEGIERAGGQGNTTNRGVLISR